MPRDHNFVTLRAHWEEVRVNSSRSVTEHDSGSEGRARGVPRGSVPVGAKVAAVLIALQALVIVGAIVFYGYEILQGATDDVTRAVMSMVMMALFVIGLAVCARGLAANRAWARTPTVVWSVLLIPVGYGMVQGHVEWIGIAVLTAAIATIAGVVTSARRTTDQA